MNPRREATATVNLVIPARTISGSPDEAVAEIDTLVETLLAVRQSVERPAATSRLTGESGWKGRVRLLLLRHQPATSANR